MLWVLKRTLSMRRFFWAPKTYVQTVGKENIVIFTQFFFCVLKRQLRKTSEDSDRSRLCDQWVNKAASFLHTDSKDSDQSKLGLG